MSAYERRFPTHVNDVAKSVTLLVDKYFQNDSDVRGIYHWSGEEMMTKYDMAVAMAEVFGLPANHIQADSTPSSGATRPYDAHLASSRKEALGANFRTPFRVGIKECLLSYI